MIPRAHDTYTAPAFVGGVASILITVWSKWEGSKGNSIQTLFVICFSFFSFSSICFFLAIFFPLPQVGGGGGDTRTTLTYHTVAPSDD